MKWIYSLLFFLSIASFGQSDDSAKYIHYPYQYGIHIPRLWADSVLKAKKLVKFTGLTPSTDTTIYKPLSIDASGNVSKMSSWPVTPGTDTTSLSNRINLKLNISDTTNKWVNDIVKRNDSIFIKKNGSEQFRYKDSTGGGGISSIEKRRDSLLYNTNTVVDIGEKFVGSIYNDTSWANLNDFVQVGGTNFTITGDTIQGTGGIGNFSKTLNLNVGAHDTTNLQKWKMSGNFRPKSTKASNTYGFGLGIRSTNDGHRYNAAVQFDATNTATSGKLMIYGGVDSTVLVTSDSAVSFSVDDEINLTIEQYDNNLLVSARNVTTNSATVTAKYIYEFQTGAVMHNSGQFAVFSFGGTFTFDSLSVESAEIRNANVLVATDSKGAGYDAGSFGESWANLLAGRYKTVVNVAGGSDATTQLITRISEIIDLAPKQVLLQIPSNDVRFGVSDPTSHSNYQRIVDSLHAHNIAVYHLTPIYETSVDLSTQVSYIWSTFSADSIIDVWNPTKISGTVYTDNIHPNTFGHQKVFEAIVSSNKLYGANVPLQAAGSANYFPKFLGPTGFGISHLSDDNTYINSTLNHNITNASPQLFLNESDGATNGKVWGIRANSNNFDINLFADAYTQPGATGFRLNRTTTSFNYAEVLTNLGVQKVPDAGVVFNVNGLSQLEGMTRLRTATDYNWEMYQFGSVLYLISINNARNSSPTSTSIAAGTNLIFHDYTTGSTVERARFSGNEFLIGSSTDQGSYTLQNTGGLYQNGTFNLRGVTAPPSTYNVLVHGLTDSTVYQMPLSSIQGITSINSQTGPSITISGDATTGVSASASSNTVTIATTFDIESFNSDANNTGTGETDLYSSTIAANKLTLNGKGLRFRITGTNNDATATAQIKGYFAGTNIFDSGALTMSAAGDWVIDMEIQRTTSTTAAATVTFSCANTTVTLPVKYTALTSQDWTTTNIFKVTGTAGGGGGGSNDITAHAGKVVFVP